MRDSNSDKTLTGRLQVKSQIQMFFFAVVLADPVSWLHYCTDALDSLFSPIIVERFSSRGIQFHSWHVIILKNLVFSTYIDTCCRF